MDLFHLWLGNWNHHHHTTFVSVRMTELYIAKQKKSFCFVLSFIGVRILFVRRVTHYKYYKMIIKQNNTRTQRESNRKKTKSNTFGRSILWFIQWMLVNRELCVGVCERALNFVKAFGLWIVCFFNFLAFFWCLNRFMC